MSGISSVVMGDRGRLVVPQDVRVRLGLVPGSTLALVESSAGLLLLTREQLKALVRRDLEGESLVERLIADRIREAVDDAPASPGSSTVA